MIGSNNAAGSGPKVTDFGLDLAALGRPAYINVGSAAELPEKRSIAAMRLLSWDVLDAAYAAGVRRVDVARSYGLGEEFLAGWLEKRRHTDVVVSSKWGYYYVGDWMLDADVHEVKEHSANRLRMQWSTTRALVGEWLSLYQVHSLTPDSPLFTDPELRAELADLRARGLRIGFSTSGPWQGETVRRAMSLGLFDAVQSTWNPLEPSVGPALAEAHEAGLEVTVKEALANGRLPVRPPDALAQRARELGVGADAVALAVAASQPWADTVLLGAAGVSQLHANLAAVGLEVGELDVAAEEPETYWKTRSALAWQ